MKTGYIWTIVVVLILAIGAYAYHSNNEKVMEREAMMQQEAMMKADADAKMKMEQDKMEQDKMMATGTMIKANVEAGAMMKK